MKMHPTLFFAVLCTFHHMVFDPFSASLRGAELFSCPRIAPDAKVFVAIGQGSSMLPVAESGSVVYFEIAPFSDLKTGDWIAYRAEDGRMITHVLRVRSGNGWYVQGLANRFLDLDWVHKGNYLGRVFAVLPPSRSSLHGIEVANR